MKHPALTGKQPETPAELEALLIEIAIYVSKPGLVSPWTPTETEAICSEIVAFQYADGGPVEATQRILSRLRVLGAKHNRNGFQIARELEKLRVLVMLGYCQAPRTDQWFGFVLDARFKRWGKKEPEMVQDVARRMESDGKKSA